MSLRIAHLLHVFLSLQRDGVKSLTL